MQPSLRRLLPLLALPLAACVADSEVGATRAQLAHDGPWDIPADTAAIGDSQSIAYTGAGPWVGSSGCSGSLTPGAGVMRDWLRVAFPQISSIGGYSCRAINGDSSTMSVHATGRALDVMLPLHGGEADNDLGDPIGNYLIEHAEEMGIQYIIWDRWTWSGSRAAGSKERSYGGAHPHHDHLHVELSVDAANMRTPWFRSSMPLPDVECPALGGDGGVIDEASDCFTAYGPAQYWRSVSAGHGGSLLWTNAFQSTSPSNWARWHLGITTADDYVVEVHAPGAYSAHRATRYAVRHAGAEHALEVDLSGADGWVTLGTFRFDGTGAEHISVYDNSPNAVPADQRIPADAVRLTRVVPEPTPDPGTGPEPEPEPGPRTVTMWQVVEAEIAPLPGGDPRIDDDGFEHHGGGALTGSCSAGGPARGGWAIALLAPLALIARRRRGSR